MWPMAKAMVSTVRPNASETPSNPIPTSGNAAARTALPQPPRTNQNVPINSATKRFANGIGGSPCERKPLLKRFSPTSPLQLRSLSIRSYVHYVEKEHEYIV